MKIGFWVALLIALIILTVLGKIFIVPICLKIMELISANEALRKIIKSQNLLIKGMKHEIKLLAIQLEQLKSDSTTPKQSGLS